MKVFSAGLAELDGAFTASLALQLDLPCAPSDPGLVKDFTQGEYGRIDSQLRLFDVFAGLPWSLMYKRLSEMFPDAAFVQVGPASGEEWVDDLVDGSAEFACEVALALGLDTLIGHEAELAQRYDEHLAAVRDWFAGRPGSLLTVSVREPLAMDWVVNHLVAHGLEIPQVPRQSGSRLRLPRL